MSLGSSGLRLRFNEMGLQDARHRMRTGSVQSRHSEGPSRWQSPRKRPSLLELACQDGGNPLVGAGFNDEMVSVCSHLEGSHSGCFAPFSCESHIELEELGLGGLRSSMTNTLAVEEAFSI